MREEEPESLGADQDRLPESGEESEASSLGPRDTESRPFIEKPILRSAKRSRWLLAQPPDDAGESQMRT